MRQYFNKLLSIFTSQQLNQVFDISWVCLLFTSLVAFDGKCDSEIYIVQIYAFAGIEEFELRTLNDLRVLLLQKLNKLKRTVREHRGEQDYGCKASCFGPNCGVTLHVEAGYGLCKSIDLVDA